MKRISALFFALYATMVSAATLSPVQLLNPAGSTVGQTIVSNGAGSAPTWQSVPASGLATQAANTILGNGTASTAAPTALPIPSCSTTTSALQWTSGTGYSCGTSFANLGGATFTGAITPSQTAGIVGTTTNNNANAGSVGEYLTATTTNTAMTNGVAANMTSVSLTAGDWDVECNTLFHPAGTTVVTGLAVGISTTSASLGAFGTLNYIQASFNTGSNNYVSAPTVRVSVAATTTAYCVGVANFGTSTMQGDGFIRARRVR